MTIKLTEIEEKFIAALFSEEAQGNVNRACEMIGYNKANAMKLFRQVKDEVVRRAEEYVALQSPKAAIRIGQVLDDPATLGATNILAAANTILDRAGITKKDRVELDIKAPTGILILPSKDSK